VGFELVALEEGVEHDAHVWQLGRERVHVGDRARVRHARLAQVGHERVVAAPVGLAEAVLADERRGRLGDVVPQDADQGVLDHGPDGRVGGELAQEVDNLPLRREQRVWEVSLLNSSRGGERGERGRRAHLLEEELAVVEGCDLASACLNDADSVCAGRGGQGRGAREREKQSKRGTHPWRACSP